MSLAVLETAAQSYDVLEGALSLPLRGVWSARLELDADTEVTGAATLVLARDDGADPQRFVGTITRSKLHEGRARLILAGGAGRLKGPRAPTLAPRSYVGTPTPLRLSTVVGDICQDAGETLAPAALATLDALSLPRWTRAAGPGGTALEALAEAGALEGWRVLPDGTVTAGPETWPTFEPVGFYEQHEDGQLLAIEGAPEAADILPGMVVGGRRISEVVYSMGGTFRVDLFYREAA